MQDKIIEWNNYHLDILSSDKPKCITKIGSTEAVHIAEYIKTNGQYGMRNLPIFFRISQKMV